jgi:astacin
MTVIEDSEQYGSSDKPTMGSGFISESTFINKHVEFEIIDGFAIFEGDIILGRVDDISKTPIPVPEGLGITGDKYRWSKKTVTYAIDSGLPDQDRVTDAIKHWESNTVMKFKKRTDEKDYITFKKGSGCSSQVGKRGGEQFIILANGCSLGNTIHEIGHAVGLWHEQGREDRDKNVTIVWDNIIENKKHNFYQRISDGDDIGSYDFGSIMHYGAYAFAIDKTKVTIKCDETVGQRKALSKGDIAAVAELYK